MSYNSLSLLTDSILDANKKLTKIDRMFRRLPYDAQIEYLESTGAQWINTGVSPVASTFGIDIVFSPKGSASPQRPFGCRNSSISAGRGSYNVLFVSDWSCRIDMIGTSTWSVPMSSNSINHLIATPSGVTVNGEYKANISDGKIDCQYPFYLFSINNTGTVWKSDKGSLAIYSCKIYESNTIVHDFIPVRVGTVGYLYDKVSGKLFGNAGTGKFVLGPDVVETEYVESTGAQYVDPGISGTSGSIQCKLGGTGTSQTFFLGAVASNGRVLLLDYGTLYAGRTGYFDGGTIGRTYFYAPFPISTGKQPWSLSSSVSLYCFRSTGTGISGYYNGRLYLAKFWNAQDTLVRDFIPVRVGSVGALYDRVTDTVFRSATSTPLIAGPDKLINSI